MQQPEQPKLYDIYGVEYNPWFLQSWFLYSVVFFVIVLLGYAVYCWYSKRKKPALSYTQKTIQALDVLEKSNWSDHKGFYIKLTQIVKWYLQEHFKKPFVATTDAECLRILQTDTFIPESITDKFEELIEGVMLVKFANAQSAHERMQKDLQSVRSIVESMQTK